MTCSQCVGAGKFFNTRIARSELKRYARRGPRSTTRMLISFLAGDTSARDATVLDIGGGIGAVHLELLAVGAERAVSVDAAPAYIQVARRAAEDRGYEGRVEHVEGDFLDVADTLATADLVALDRVVCCYPDAKGLVRAAASKARKRLGLVVPRDGWWMRALLRVPNMYMRLRRNPFRVYGHPHAVLHEAANAGGLLFKGRSARGLWAVLTYERDDPI